VKGYNQAVIVSAWWLQKDYFTYSRRRALRRPWKGRCDKCWAEGSRQPLECLPFPQQCLLGLFSVLWSHDPSPRSTSGLHLAFSHHMSLIQNSNSWGELLWNTDWIPRVKLSLRRSAFCRTW
jgi:hypothetical protein